MENSILDFIQNTFKDAQTINLEKVGQYLKNENLRFHVSDENNWYSFLKSKLSDKENQSLHFNKKEKSLIGCFEDFKQTLNETFKSQALSSKQPFIFIKQYNIHKFNSTKDANEMLLSYKCLPNAMVTGLLMAKSNNECYILKHSINNDPDVKAFIINLSSHAMDILQLAHTRVLNDLNNENNETSSSKSKDSNLLMIKAEKLNSNSIIKYIKKLKSSCFCVSSSRKVAALVCTIYLRKFYL